jgi:ferredoxin
MTLLEISRANGVAHASLCGGRGRCGTCRVTVTRGMESLPAPQRTELATLRALDATGPVRLACQIRPSASLAVELLVRPDAHSTDTVVFFEVKDLVAAHVRAIEADALVDVVVDDPDKLRGWQDGQFDALVAASAAAQDQFRFLGVRSDYLRERPAATLAYQRAGQIISLFVLPSRPDDALALSGASDGYVVRGWSDDRCNYYAVANLPGGDLEKLEERLQERPAQQRPVTVL